MQKIVTKGESWHADMMKRFNKPMTKKQAMEAFAADMDDQSNGQRAQDVRIIIR